MSRRLVVRISKAEVPLGDTDVDQIVGELELLTWDGSRLDPESAIEELAKARQTRSTNLLDWPWQAQHAFARALDHLRNLEPKGPERWGNPFRLARLRDLTIGVCGLPFRKYEVVLDHPDAKYREFWSYTGEYEPGDRLVRGDGRVFRVLDRRPGAVLDQLICRPWEQ